MEVQSCVQKFSDSVDRRFCFEVSSPERTYILQATSEDERASWMVRLSRADTTRVFWMVFTPTSPLTLPDVLL